MTDKCGYVKYNSWQRIGPDDVPAERSDSDVEANTAGVYYTAVPDVEAMAVQLENHPLMPVLMHKAAAMLRQLAVEDTRHRELIASLGVQLCNQQGEINRLDADAERYRWLRDAQDGDIYMENTASTLDAAVDAAIKETE